MLADFSIRLACGMAGMLLVTPWKQVPPGFFRTHCQVILGLLVLGVIDGVWTRSPKFFIGATIASAVLAYAATVCWGLGLPRVATPLTAILTVLTGLTLVSLSQQTTAGGWALDSATRLASAFLLGATLSAMLLGHYYLNAPAMTITPLRREVAAMGLALAVRTALAAVGLYTWFKIEPTFSAGTLPQANLLFLSMRWGMGVLGPALASVLAWKTVKIRSTQSATGILYIAMTLVLFGELTALILSREVGWSF